MGSSKAKPIQTPFKQEEQRTNTYAPYSVAGSQEAQDFMNVPLNFGGSYGDLNTDVQIDPGVGRRTALAEQEVGNRWDSAFNSGVPAWIRNMNRQKEIRDVQAQGAYEGQQAAYGQQMGKRDLEYRKAQLVEGANQDRTMAELDRRRMLLPQILQTGGSSNSSGFGTQVVQPQPGFWQRAGLAAIGGAASLPKFGLG